MRGLLVFDLDGTLLDTGRDLCATINDTRVEFGLAVLPDVEAMRFVGDGFRKLCERTVQDHPPPGPSIEHVMERCRVHYGARLLGTTQPYPGVEDGLRRLRSADYRLALLTNKPEPAALKLMDHFALSPLFDRMVGGAEGIAMKPDPTTLLAIMKDLGCGDVNRCWMIGDHRTDIEVARRAGIRSVFLTYGIGRTEQETPTLVFHRFEDLTLFFLTPPE